jgi:asparagine synthase (glutamine-hydrolysing)
MCGIAGIITPEGGWDEARLSQTARAMADAMAHRGPDDSGVWADAQAGVALAHRRLSIMDLSAHGRQPMVSASGRYVLSFNGEIYNFKALRTQLDYPFQGDSDTEVLLAAIECWGVQRALSEISGMFAFALWDKQTKILSLARDRMGEKPLYYGWVNGVFGFASELAALRTMPHFAPPINRDALAQFVGYSYVPTPMSIFEGIQKLPAAHMAVLKGHEVDLTPYWSLTEAGAPFAGDDAAALSQLDECLSAAVGRMMVADVPLGAFLSGGVDSSTIVALMQAQSARPVKTFSIGFDEPRFNEAPYAKAVAEHLRTDHTELYVSAKQAQEVIPRLASMYSEPFADSSQIPTFLVAQMARQHVTVALSGDGGDELFGGYNRYRHGVRLWQAARWLPKPLRSDMITTLALKLNQLQPRAKWHKIANYAEKLSASNRAEFYANLCTATPDYVQLVIGADTRQLRDDGQADFAQWMMLQDGLGYLPDDILTKVDRAAMAVSLETRIPFLDPEVIGFAQALPKNMKIRGGQGKWLLRQLLYQHVPSELIDRPKVGFAVPLAEWLRGPLRPWAEDLLAPESLKRQGYLDVLLVWRYWQEHQAGMRDHSQLLWNIVMFQSWLVAQG